MSISKHPFGILLDGQTASLYTLTGAAGLSVSLSDYGGTVVRIMAQDRFGLFRNVVCGYDSAVSYARGDGYLGATVGRVCNRIANGRFTLDGKLYDGLYINDGSNHLHGGRIGFSHRLWEVEALTEGEEPSLTMHLLSPDGEEAYPGTLDVTVTFTVTAGNALSIHYLAVTDKPTPVNLTNHTYFNLGGYASGDVLDQVLWLDAESYLRTDAGLVPTGEVVPVEGTPFDFRTAPKAIGKDFLSGDVDLRTAGGYDHCMNFTGWQQADSTMRLRGRVYDPDSGCQMELFTNSPCVQLYTANFLNNPAFSLSGGYAQRKRHAFCLETQKMPDAVHHREFTDTILRPGQTFDFMTVYKFSTV